uniref:Peroxiredoxin like 2C n=1 Tax=Leptobrachium leishanense TaxID=445787 RepID=A0A8C5LQC7_9ANUR
MASESLPVTQQIGRSLQDVLCEELYHPDLGSVTDCLLRDRAGTNVQFGDLYRDKKAIIVFVRNFLCYTCKEYVEDLAKIPKSFLEDADVRLIVIGQASYVHIPNFCSLTGYPHEMYVDSEREIYNKLGMKRGETSTTPARSPHVKSSLISGSIKSIYRAMTSPAFDFQGDLAQQGGTLIVGPVQKIARDDLFTSTLFLRAVLFLYHRAHFVFAVFYFSHL